MKVLVTFYANRSVKKDLPLKEVQAFIKSAVKSEQETDENDFIMEKREKRLAKLEELKLESSCQIEEPKLVEFEPKKTKKQMFSNWIKERKKRFCNALYKFCCCSTNNLTVS